MCDKTANQNKNPRLKTAGVFLAVSFLVCLAAVSILTASLRRTVPLNIAEYNGETLPDFEFECTATIKGNYIFFDGYAIDSSEKLETVNNFVVLYNSNSNTYLRLPTSRQTNLYAHEKYGRYSGGSLAGFSAYILQKELKDAPQAYELCFAYGSNNANSLVHTGCFLPNILHENTIQTDSGTVIAEWRHENEDDA